MNDARKSVEAVLSHVPNGVRHQERSRATRRELISAARDIFSRDGFQLTRLEDIAAAAGKSRGAFYANFKDKEDVFFAIVEQDIAADSRALHGTLNTASSPEERLDVLARYLLSLLDDKPRMLLSLEFKLYCIRRPQHHKRIADLHAEMCVRCAETNIDHLLPEFSHNLAGRKRKAALFGAAMEGLVLNRLFQPDALDAESMLALIKAALRIALGQPASPEAPTLQNP